MQNGCKIVKSKSLNVIGSNLIIELKPINLQNDEHFEIIICQNVPEEASELDTVKISINSNLTVPLKNMTGNYTRADQIKSRTRYPVVFGVDPLHVSLLRRIYPSKFNYEEINFIKGDL